MLIKNNIKDKKIELTMNVLFSGIGCQERGIENTKLFNVNIVSTAEISKEAVLSYAAVHCNLTQEMIDTYTEYPTREEMARQLTEINLGYDVEKDKAQDWYKVAKKKTNEINKYWLANKISHNLGDIGKITELPYADLWTISFCCQDISTAGKMKGLKPDSGTRSSLLWENIRLLKKAIEDKTAPKYLLFENVKNLVSKKFIDDYNKLLEILKELGYNSYWKVLNAKNCGIPQNRERVFVICIRKDIDKVAFTFPEPFDNGLRLKDMLEEDVDESYYIENEKALEIIKENEKGSTLKYRIRKLTAIECWKLMGMTAEDNKSASKLGVSNTQLYKQAGNGIVTNCIELLFEHLYKAQYNKEYKCYDERVYNEQNECKVKIEGNIYPSGGQNGNIINVNGISTTISAGIGNSGNGVGSNNAPKILINENFM